MSSAADCRASSQQLVIFDIYENNAYDIEQELKKKYPDLNLVTLIGSVRDSRRMQMVFDTYRPQIVYHAAAHKHVPLMEASPQRVHQEQCDRNLQDGLRSAEVRNRAFCADQHGQGGQPH